MRCELDNVALCLERRELTDQRAAELGRQRALLASFVLGDLVVLSRRGLGQVRSRVREHRLLTEQQGEGQQEVGQGTLDSHWALVLERCADGAALLGRKSSPNGVDFKARELPGEKPRARSV